MYFFWESCSKLIYDIDIHLHVIAATTAKEPANPIPACLK
jgi:hypothetical protein